MGDGPPWLVGNRDAEVLVWTGAKTWDNGGGLHAAGVKAPAWGGQWPVPGCAVPVVWRINGRFGWECTWVTVSSSSRTARLLFL